MVERICPTCQHGNPVDNRFCGACGATLQHNALAARSPGAIMIAGQQLPVAQIKQVGRVLAVGLATVAAEAGLAWLRRRSEGAQLPTLALRQPPAQTVAPQANDLVRDTVTIVSQRVVEIWEQGSLTRQVIEKHVWRKEG